MSPTYVYMVFVNQEVPARWSLPPFFSQYGSSAILASGRRGSCNRKVGVGTLVEDKKDPCECRVCHGVFGLVVGFVVCWGVFSASTNISIGGPAHRCGWASKGFITLKAAKELISWGRPLYRQHFSRGCFFAGRFSDLNEYVWRMSSRASDLLAKSLTQGYQGLGFLDSLGWHQ